MASTIEYWARFQNAPRLTAPAHADWVGHDFFCGFGGFSIAAYWVEGIKLAVVNAVNHNPLCISVHQRNHPPTEHHCADMLNPKQFEPGYLPKADFALFSPECRAHSGAKGIRELTDYVEDSIGRQLSLFEEDDLVLAERNQRWLRMSDQERAQALWQAERSRLTMGQVVRMVEHHRYKFYIVENVVEVVKWRHFEQWYGELEALGYKIVPLCLNSMFFGAPQSRDRVYFFCYQKGLPDPDLDWYPLAYCPHCQKDVNAGQTWKKPGQKYGKYRAQYHYCCPVCSSVAQPYVRGADAIIDWSLPMHQVKERQDPFFCRKHRVRPLKTKTRERIGAGLRQLAKQALIETAYSQAGVGGKVKPVESPLFTQTSRQSAAISTTTGHFISTLRSGRPRNQRLEDPLPAFTGTNNFVLIDSGHPQVVGGGVSGCVGVSDVGKVGVSAAGGVSSSREAEVGVGGGCRLNGVATVQASIQSTATSTPNSVMVVMRGTGAQHNVVSEPISTLTTVNHHALVDAGQMKPQVFSYYGREQVCRAVDEPVGTITPEPRHALLNPPRGEGQQERSHILTYHGVAGWHRLKLPLTTQTTKERHALVLPDGRVLDLDDPVQLEQAVDECRFRMLDWREARRGMTFPENYRLTNNKSQNFFGLGQAVTPVVIPWMIERAVAVWG